MDPPLYTCNRSSRGYVRWYNAYLGRRKVPQGKISLRDEAVEPRPPDEADDLVDHRSDDPALLRVHHSLHQAPPRK